MIIVVSISGGKDSTATAILALETGHECRFLFADTGHEHPLNYEYLSYLENRLDIHIDTVKADFSAQIYRKRETVKEKWVAEGVVTCDQSKQIAERLKATGIPFLDLCLWKGRFPSAKRRFCTEELKHRPLEMELLNIWHSTQSHIESWQGVRADESRNRSKLPQREAGDCAEIYRPILYWSVAEVFALLKRRGVQPNPLYRLGMSRVGCMPCIYSRKSELREISIRFPREVHRVANWEERVSDVSKRSSSTFFAADLDPTKKTKNNDEVSHKTHGIYSVMDWAKTTRGGRQYDLIATEEPTMCRSVYGLCE